MIKHTAKEMHFQKNVSEIQVGNALDEGFDVNFGQIYKNNNIEVSYYFLGAKEQFMRRFGFEQEILAVYDAHEKSDARIFSAVSDLLNRYKKTRIDPAVVLIIIEGEKTDIQAMLDRHKEIAYVVIEKAKLLDKRRSSFFLRREFSKVLGSMDLFSLSSPLETDTYLFGREDLLVQTINKVNHQKENSGIFGLRKTGKTSVLFALKRRFSELGILGVYIDCQRPIHRYRWWRLLEYTASKISSELENIGEEIDKTLSNNYTEDNCQQKFEGIIKKGISGNYKKIVLLFDEIEYITPTLSMVGATHWDEDFLPFWQTIRGMHQETHARLSFILAGVNPYIVENTYIRDKQNPIFQLVQPTYLEPLDRTVVRNMVRSIGKYLGMKFDEEVYDFLKKEYGGHAFLIRLACSELFKNSKDKINENEYKFNIHSFLNVNSQIKARLRSPSMDIVLSLLWWYPEEYELLKIVCDGDSEFVKLYIEENLTNYSHIVNYGLLYAESYELHIRTIADYIKNFGLEWEKMVSPFKRSGFTEDELPSEANLNVLSEIYEKRASLEQTLRKIIYVYLATTVAFDSVKIAKKISEGMKSEDSKDLFFGREAKQVMNEIYFKDLHAIINKNWSIFSELFENQKQRFDMNMETISNVRNLDAHVKPISDSEKVNFDNSYAWVLHYIKKVDF